MVAILRVMNGFTLCGSLMMISQRFTFIDGMMGNAQKDNYILINELSNGPPRQSQYSEHQGSCSQLWGALFITFISVNRRIFRNSK